MTHHRRAFTPRAWYRHPAAGPNTYLPVPVGTPNSAVLWRGQSHHFGDSLHQSGQHRGRSAQADTSRGETAPSPGRPRWARSGGWALHALVSQADRERVFRKPLAIAGGPGLGVERAPRSCRLAISSLGFVLLTAGRGRDRR